MLTSIFSLDGVSIKNLLHMLVNDKQGFYFDFGADYDDNWKLQGNVCDSFKRHAMHKPFNTFYGPYFSSVLWLRSVLFQNLFLQKKLGRLDIMGIFWLANGHQIIDGS